MTSYGSPKKSGMSTATKILLGLVVALVAAAFIQGLTVQQIGFGPFSVSFTNKNDGGGSHPGDGTNPDQSRPSDGTGNQTHPSDASTSGTWSQTRANLTVTVTQVDVQGGYIQLHTKVDNAGDQPLTLPLFGDFTASDNAGHTFTADPFASQWSDTAPAHGTLSGIIRLQQSVTSAATSLSISFTTVFGQDAPSGGITVHDIPVPHAA